MSADPVLVGAVEALITQDPMGAGGFTAKDVATYLSEPVTDISAVLQYLKRQGKVRCGGGNTWWLTLQRQPVAKPRQQYRTADGSIWEKWIDPVDAEVKFDRVDSPDGAHEDDFRPQKLDEVLRSWGALSLYDPEEEVRQVLIQVLHAAGWTTADVTQVRTVVSQLERHGYRLTQGED